MTTQVLMEPKLRRVVAVLLLALACRVGPGEEKDKGTGADTGTDLGDSAVEDSDSGEEGDSDTDTDSDTETDSDTDTDDYVDVDFVEFEGELVTVFEGTYDGSVWTNICTTAFSADSDELRTDCPDCVFAFGITLQVERYDYCAAIDYYVGLGYSQTTDPRGMRTRDTEPYRWTAYYDATFDGENFDWYKTVPASPAGTGYFDARLTYDGHAAVRRRH